MPALHIFFVVSCFFSFALNMILYPWHISVADVPGLSILSWLTVASIAYGINASVFGGDSLLMVPYYCDILTKVLVGTQMGVSISVTCYAFQFTDWLCQSNNRRLKAKRLVYRPSFHVALCVVAPIAYMSLHIAAQGHRFDIVENFGCIPSTEVSVLGFIIIWILPILPCCVTLGYGVTTLRYLRHHNHRRSMSTRQMIFEGMNSGLYFTKAPYGIYRILRMSTVAFLIVVWITLTPILPIIVFAHSDTLSAFKSPDLSRIDVFNSYADASPGAISMQLYLWSIPFFSILFFLANIDTGILETFQFLFRKLVPRHSAMKPGPKSRTNAWTTTSRRWALMNKGKDAPITNKELGLPVTEPNALDLISDDERRSLLEAMGPEKALPLAEFLVQCRREAGLDERGRSKAIPEDAKPKLETETETEPKEQRKRVVQLNEHRNDRSINPTWESEARKQLREHVEANRCLPLHDIPESPRSMTMPAQGAITSTLEEESVETPSSTKSEYAETDLDKIVISDAFPAGYQFQL